MKKPEKKMQLVRVDSRTWIEIPINRDPEKAKEQFIERQLRLNDSIFPYKKIR